MRTAALLDGEACQDRHVAFEQGAVLVWPDLPLPQLPRLQALAVLEEPRFRKLKLPPLDKVEVRREPWSRWARSTDEAKRLYVETFLPARDWLVAFVRRQFPRYRFVGRMETWRFTETRNAAMHFDSYAERVADLSLRLFVNVDTAPRVWALGPDLLDYAAANYERHGLAKTKTLSEAALACSKGMPQEGWPRWEIPPGTAWIVQSQRAGHQVLFGRRMIGFAFHIEADSLVDRGASPQGLLARINARGQADA